MKEKETKSTLDTGNPYSTLPNIVPPVDGMEKMQMDLIDRKAAADSRYPYTYACDYIRSLAGYGENGTKLSRSDASKIYSGIAKALHVNERILAGELADYYKANEETITSNSVQEFSHFYR